MRMFFQKLAIPALLACFMFISGCTWVQNRRLECASPYISIGNQCCLDQNNNSICDEDETQLLENNSNATQHGNGTVANHSGNFSNTPCPLPGEFVEFYGQGCHFCADMVSIVLQVENETGVQFTVLEVWYNNTNHDMFMQYADQIQRDCGALGVPAFINLRTNKSVCGEMSLQELGDFVQENKRCEEY